MHFPQMNSLSRLATNHVSNLPLKLEMSRCLYSLVILGGICSVLSHRANFNPVFTSNEIVLTVATRIRTVKTNSKLKKTTFKSLVIRSLTLWPVIFQF